ncbi:MAG: RNA 2',3'-cyclic phosphodiesterase [Clostridiales bacterium]|jgi:2'-5' RNA ligase|nr:RNA 2',3'-cyclic phosphodiesterase [Clostridiales bacterium]
MRLFIAINFSIETKTRLLGLCEELRAVSTRGNFSHSDTLHVTLAFLGECDQGKADKAKAVLDKMAFSPFEVGVERIGYFKTGYTSLWWAGLKESRELLSLQAKLAESLTATGFVLETRKFNPHITLGREVVNDVLPREVEPFGETIKSVELMLSERINRKVTYTAIHSVKAK